MLESHPIYDDEKYGVGSILTYPVPKDLIELPFIALEGTSLKKEEYPELYLQMQDLFSTEDTPEDEFGTPDFSYKLTSAEVLREYYGATGCYPRVISIGDPEEWAFVLKVFPASKFFKKNEVEGEVNGK